MELRAKEGRQLPKTDQKVFFDLWYNILLPQIYPKEILDKFCCEVPL